MSYTVLILTHLDKETNKILLPHFKWICKTNPDADVKIIIGEDSPMGKRYNWKNGDQPLRKWWKENHHLVNTTNVAVIEWDTLVNCKLPDIPEGFDLVGAQYMQEPFHLRSKWIRKSAEDPTWKEENWLWWREIPRLELKENERAIGLVSLGCFLMKRWVLDAVAKNQWDKVYNKDIISEMRFPTIAAIEGAKVGKIHLPFVHHCKMTYTGEKEIYHPIKETQ